ncbi:MAG: hypothetical protein AB1716_09685 [Planctomycetota bacterium]
MIGPGRENWLAIACDGAGALLVAVHGAGDSALPRARTYIEFAADDLARDRRLPRLGDFVREHGLAGCPAYVAFSGAATVVQALHMPPLSARNRQRAVTTRLQTYAGGQQLAIALAASAPPDASGAHLLAAGVPLNLARGLFAACSQAGVRVRGACALAAAVPPTSAAGSHLQVLLGERTCTVQLFQAGRLAACRDLLLGRRDFVQAYQRPILTDGAAVTLSAADAEQLLERAGVPVGREDEVWPGIPATQLWPTLDPVLQKLHRELEQTLKSNLHAAGPTLSVLSAAPVPGLAEFLGSDLQLACAPLHGQPTAIFLEALRTPHTPLDLRPPEVRLGERLSRWALAAAAGAFLVVLANGAGPRNAQAQLAALRPAAENLTAQRALVAQRYAAAQQDFAALRAQRQREALLMQRLPPAAPLLGPLRSALGAVPSGMRLLSVELQASATPATLHLRASYSGELPASVVAARWARALSAAGPFADARVTAVSGSGRSEPAVVELRADLK